ncbi:hypothetical protein HDU96_005331, partial [Phlyctochytrium bullatum]
MGRNPLYQQLTQTFVSKRKGKLNAGVQVGIIGGGVGSMLQENSCRGYVTTDCGVMKRRLTPAISCLHIASVFDDDPQAIHYNLRRIKHIYVIVGTAAAQGCDPEVV